jgi:hypothetical protein
MVAFGCRGGLVRKSANFTYVRILLVGFHPTMAQELLLPRFA